MDRNRESRRASIVGSNGFNRRRHRTNSLRDSPDEDAGMELQESVRLRDRVKKDRDRERDRDRDRERERERERDLRERSSRSKRRRGERLPSNREDIGGDETSEESVNDEEDDEDEETATTTGSGGVRLLTQAVAGSATNHHHGHLSNHHHGHGSNFSQHPQHNSNNSTSNTVSSNHHLQHRKSFPPTASTAKISRAPPVWKSGEETISAPVPRKARSASTKRSHDWISISSNNSGGGVSGGEPNLVSSPARQGVVPTPSPTPLPAAPISPSSSNASMRKKPKPMLNNSGPKLKPPKMAPAGAASKPSSSNPEELEIEIAEVLYGLMTQSQAPLPKKEDSREINKLNSDVKSRNSSPIPNSTSANNSILGSNSGALSAVAPKRKRPRQIPENSSYGSRGSPIPSKPDAEQTPKRDISSHTTEKISGSASEHVQEKDLEGPQPEQPAPMAAGSAKIDSELKRAAEENRESRDSAAKEEARSPKVKEYPAVRMEVFHNGDSPAVAAASASTKTNSTATEMESRKEEKFEIDLMAPPPQAKPSPEKEVKNDLRDSQVDRKPVVSVTDPNLKMSKDKAEENGRSGSFAAERKVKASGEEAESNKERNVDFEKPERDCGDGVGHGIKLQPLTQKQQQTPLNEKPGHSASSLPLQMSMASWPGGLPPMGYMAPLQGVVSVEGGAVAPGHIQPNFSQPRPKRCATHCHIAKNIYYLQQFMKMNPFWPAPAGTALFGSKPCNLNVIPGLELHGNVAVRGVSSSQDKSQSIATVPIHDGKEKAPQPTSTSESAQRKQQQILIQQTMPPVAPSNLLGPTFIFPLNQQQQGAAPRPTGVKPPATGVSSNTSTSGVTNSSSAAAVSFNYPNIPSNETQYLAILQNNGYPYPIPAAAVGGPPNYRGAPAQAMPLFSGSFYSSQMIHPAQLQHAQPQSIQSQLFQAQQNASASSGSSTAQKHLQSQHQRMQSGSGGISTGSGTGSLQNLSSQKSQPSQQQLQQSHNQYVHQSRARHLEGEPGREDSPSTTDSRGSRPSTMNIYGQNFAMPIHQQNFGLMNHPAAAAALSSAVASTAMCVSSNNHGDKKGHQLPQQQQGSKAVPESMPAHTFAMTFGTINGASGGQGVDITSMAQNHALFQSSSEAATRQNIQMMAAAAAAQAAHNNKKSFRICDDGKSGAGDSSSATEDERKGLSGKGMGGGGQSIAFTRSDIGDGPVSSIQVNSVIESSTRSLNAASGPRSSRSLTTNAMGAMNVQNAHSIQAQFQQQHMLQQLKQQHQQHQQQQQLQQQMAVNRSKVAVTSNGGMYSEHFSSSSTKLPTALSGFSQNLVQSNNSSPSQSPQWKGSNRTPTPQNPSSLASSNTTTLKNLQQQLPRTQSPMHAQISFGGNQKPPTTSQGQPHPSSNQTSSSPVMVGSPTTSSVSKGASGSPRTTSSASTNNKTGQASALSAQPTKNPPSVSNQKSPSILGNLHVPSASSGSLLKSQIQQQQQQSQQQMSKTMQQQIFFSNPYAQSQSPHSASKGSTTSMTSGYYMQQRRQSEQQQQSPGALVTSAGSLLLGNANTNDPATAMAAATANAKGGGLQSQGINHAPQFAAQATGNLLPAGFSYPHPVPTAVQAKPAEQKQPAGNDNLNPWQPEKK